MGVKNVQIITDSFDEKQLPEETKPITITVGKRSWDLYLSDDNAGKFYDQLDKWTKNEPEKTSGSAPFKPSWKRPKSGTDELKAMRAWGQENGFTVSDRGRVSQAVQDAYRAAH
jgi:hypothetical protein